MKSLGYNSVGAAFQPRKSRLKASPTRTLLHYREDGASRHNLLQAKSSAQFSSSEPGHCDRFLHKPIFNVDTVNAKIVDNIQKTRLLVRRTMPFSNRLQHPPDRRPKRGHDESRIHETTALIAGHGRLKKIQQSLNNQIKRVAYRSLADRGHLERSCRFHREILSAIKANDKPRAEALTREHILKGMAAQAKGRSDPRVGSYSKRSKEAEHAVARS